MGAGHHRCRLSISIDWGGEMRVETPNCLPGGPRTDNSPRSNDTVGPITCYVGALGAADLDDERDKTAVMLKALFDPITRRA
jgi:hypothetical protein